MSETTPPQERPRFQGYQGADLDVTVVGGAPSGEQSPERELENRRSFLLQQKRRLLENGIRAIESYLQVPTSLPQEQQRAPMDLSMDNPLAPLRELYGWNAPTGGEELRSRAASMAKSYTGMMLSLPTAFVGILNRIGIADDELYDKMQQDMAMAAEWAGSLATLQTPEQARSLEAKTGGPHIMEETIGGLLGLVTPGGPWARVFTGGAQMSRGVAMGLTALGARTGLRTAATTLARHPKVMQVIEGAGSFGLFDWVQAHSRLDQSMSPEEHAVQGMLMGGVFAGTMLGGKPIFDKLQKAGLSERTVAVLEKAYEASGLALSQEASGIAMGLTKDDWEESSQWLIPAMRLTFDKSLTAEQRASLEQKLNVAFEQGKGLYIGLIGLGLLRGRQVNPWMARQWDMERSTRNIDKHATRLAEAAPKEPEARRAPEVVEPPKEEAQPKAVSEMSRREMEAELASAGRTPARKVSTEALRSQVETARREAPPKTELPKEAADRPSTEQTILEFLRSPEVERKQADWLERKRLAEQDRETPQYYRAMAEALVNAGYEIAPSGRTKATDGKVLDPAKLTLDDLGQAVAEKVALALESRALASVAGWEPGARPDTWVSTLPGKQMVVRLTNKGWIRLDTPKPEPVDVRSLLEGRARREPWLGPQEAADAAGLLEGLRDSSATEGAQRIYDSLASFVEHAPETSKGLVGEVMAALSDRGMLEMTLRFPDRMASILARLGSGQMSMGQAVKEAGLVAAEARRQGLLETAEEFAQRREQARQKAATEAREAKAKEGREAQAKGELKKGEAEVEAKELSQIETEVRAEEEARAKRLAEEEAELDREIRKEEVETRLSEALTMPDDVRRLGKPNLQQIAKNLGVEVGTKDTKAVLVDKIEAARMEALAEIHASLDRPDLPVDLDLVRTAFWEAYTQGSMKALGFGRLRIIARNLGIPWEQVEAIGSRKALLEAIAEQKQQILQLMLEPDATIRQGMIDVLGEVQANILDAPKGDLSAERPGEAGYLRLPSDVARIAKDTRERLEKIQPAIAGSLSEFFEGARELFDYATKRVTNIAERAGKRQQVYAKRRLVRTEKALGKMEQPEGFEPLAEKIDKRSGLEHELFFLERRIAVEQKILDTLKRGAADEDAITAMAERLDGLRQDSLKLSLRINDLTSTVLAEETPELADYRIAYESYSMAKSRKLLADDAAKAGSELKKAMHEASHEAEKGASLTDRAFTDWIAQYRDVPPEVLADAMKYANGRRTADEVGEEAVEIAEAGRAVYDLVVDAAIDLGGGMRELPSGKMVPIAKSGHYFDENPNELGWKAIRAAKAGGLLPADLMRYEDAAIRRGDYKNRDEFRNALRKWGKSLQGHSAYLESSNMRMPEEFIEWNPRKTHTKTQRRAWLRVAGAKHFGWRGEIAGDMFYRMERGGVDPAMTQKFSDFIAIEMGITKPVRTVNENKFFSWWGAYNSISKLGWGVSAPVRNSFQPLQNNPDMAWSDIIYAYAKYPFGNKLLRRFGLKMEGAAEIERWAENMGLIHHISPLTELDTTVKEIIDGGLAYLPEFLKPLAMMSATEQGNYIRQSLASAKNLRRILPKLAEADKAGRLSGLHFLWERIRGMDTTTIKRQLKDRGVSDAAILKAMETGKIDAATLETYLSQMVNRRQFPLNMSTKRFWHTFNPVVRNLFRFKQFELDQIGLLRDAVGKEFIRGNMAPLVRMAVNAAIVGEIYNAIADLFRNKKQSLLWNALRGDLSDQRIVDSLVGDWVDGGLASFLHWGTWGFLEWMLGPSISDAEKLSGGAVKAVQTGQPKRFAEEALRTWTAYRQVEHFMEAAPKVVFGKGESLGEERRQYRDDAELWQTRRDGGLLGVATKDIKLSFVTEQNWGPNTPYYRDLEASVDEGDMTAAAEAVRRIMLNVEHAEDVGTQIAALKGQGTRRAPLGGLNATEDALYLKTLPPQKQRELKAVEREWRRRWLRAVRSGVRAAAPELRSRF